MSSIRDFIPMCKLGEGSYSTVYKVRRLNDNLIYALKKVKITKLSTKQKENALNEIRILASIEDPTIVSYKEAFFDDTINVLCIVMQFASGGDLHHVISTHKNNQQRIPEQEIWNMLKNILTALQNLHSKGIMHRDLKSANIFKTDQGYKLGDLNVSKVVRGSLAYTQTGTPYYASPQVWRDEPYDAKSDVWSLGCIAYEMAALRPPFEGRSMQQLFRNVQTKTTPNIPSFYSRELTQFIQLSMKKKSHQRPTASQLLNHQSFRHNFNNHLEQQKSQEKIAKKQQLLQTIKLPADLTKLKEKLPNSKYDSEKINKSEMFLGDNFVGQVRTPKNAQKNKSDIYTSPSQKIVSSGLLSNSKTPVSMIKLSDHMREPKQKYSQRPYTSDKKSNKVERKSYIEDVKYNNINNYVYENKERRPYSQNSLPRTEKKAKERPSYQLLNMRNDIQEDIEAMRRKLVKKCRVLSGHPKPSWWG